MSARLEALVAADAGEEIVLGSPKVGVWSDHPAPGTIVGPGGSLGVLTQLARRFEIVVPEGIAGRVAEGSRKDHAIAVGYGEALVRLIPLGAAVEAAKASQASGGDTSRHVVSPTDGVFYGAPSPGAEPFVRAGGRVEAGQTIGLIEVMKTFNPIAYGGSSLPESAEVVAVLVADGEEVRAGQPLLAVR